MKTIFELQQTLRHSREELAFLYGGLREELNVPNLLRHSIRNHPWRWLSGATLTGLSLFFLKGYPHSDEIVPHLVSSKHFQKEHKKNTSSSRTGLLTGVFTLLNNNAVKAGLWSTARFLFPLAQEVVAHYYLKRQEKRQ